MKRVLITGANGFLGRNLVRVLERKYNVSTLSRSNAEFNVDLSTSIPKLNKDYNYVIHAAGKAHSVPRNSQEEQEFFKVNFDGTQRLLTSLEVHKESLETFVFISTVAVYGKDFGDKIHEEHPLDGHTAYAKSKIKAEKLVEEWCAENSVQCLILRLPLLVGPNPPGNLGVMIKGIRTGRYLSVDQGRARRSAVLVDDIAKLLLEDISMEGIYNLTDNYNPSFRELEMIIANQLGCRLPRSISTKIAYLIGLVGDVIPSFPVNSFKVKKMTSDLTFSSEKANQVLNWRPRKVIDHFKLFR